MDALKKLLQDVNTPTEQQAPQQHAPAPEEQPVVIPAQSDMPPAHAQEHAPVSEPAPAPKPPVSLEDCNDEAEAMVILFDAIQNGSIAALAKRKMNQRRERMYGDGAHQKLQILLDELDAKKKGAAAVTDRAYTPEDIGLMKGEAALQELLSDLPFDDEEIERLKKPLSKIVQKRGGILPPEWLLGLFALQMTSARLIQLSML
jgi:hypothetical protein